MLATPGLPASPRAHTLALLQGRALDLDTAQWTRPEVRRSRPSPAPTGPTTSDGYGARAGGLRATKPLGLTAPFHPGTIMEKSPTLSPTC